MLSQNVGYQGSEMKLVLLISLNLLGDPKEEAEQRITQCTLSLILCFARAFTPSLLSSVWHQPPCPDLQGVLVVMFIFTVLELLQAAFTFVLWWKQVYSNNPGVSTLKCHMVPAGSQDLSDDEQGLRSGRKRSQLLGIRYIWKLTFIVGEEFNE